MATWSLALIIAIVFACELALGGASSPPVLVRMGALVPDRLAEGEWWRLISCTFLHGGWLHILANLSVLLVVGAHLERIMGSARFLVLYAVSALAGSVGSALLLKADMSVGASGALWGLLGADAVLAFRPQGLLPPAVIARAKSTATTGLVINVLNSFRPYVDMWAHFAGGAAGALLLWSGLLTRTLPRLGEMEQSAAGEQASAPARLSTPAGIRVAAGMAALVLLAGPAAAVLSGRPLELAQEVSLASAELEELGVAVDLPAGRAKTSAQTPVGVELTFGDMLADPMVVAVLTLALPPLDEDRLAAELESLEEEARQGPEGSQLLVPPARFERDANIGMTVSYAYPSGVVYERAFLLIAGKLVRVDVVRRPGYPEAAPAGLARRIIESARLLDTSGKP